MTVPQLKPRDIFNRGSTKASDAQRHAHHERRVGDLEDVPAEHDLLADHADRVEEHAEPEIPETLKSPQPEQRHRGQAHDAHPIASLLLAGTAAAC